MRIIHWVILGGNTFVLLGAFSSPDHAFPWVLFLLVSDIVLITSIVLSANEYAYGSDEKGHATFFVAFFLITFVLLLGIGLTELIKAETEQQQEQQEKQEQLYSEIVETAGGGGEVTGKDGLNNYLLVKEDETYIVHVITGEDGERIFMFTEADSSPEEK